MNKFLTRAAFFLVPSLLLANVGTTVDNGDGTFTYTQQIDATSPTPYYTQPIDSGFGVYGFYDKDYGWQHDFPAYNTDGMTILSAKLTIDAWDVDSEIEWGTNGEYDVISVDGVDLNPGLLQGTNNTNSTTVFDIPVSNITDDGLINVFMDIDTFHNYNYWATSLDRSVVTITYKSVVNNNPPTQPTLTCTPTPIVINSDDLVVSAVSTDPDGDSVTYNYRWFVDVGQNLFTDDEIGVGIDHNGTTVPSADTSIGQLWRVEVTPVDSNGALGQSATCDWPIISNDSDGDGVDDDVDAYPNDPERAFNSYYPAQGVYNTLVFEDTWPRKGDYDLNDLVTTFNYQFITDANNKLKEIVYTGSINAAGAIYHNAFAIGINGLVAGDVDTTASTLLVNGNAETGFVDQDVALTSEAVFVINRDIYNLMSSVKSNIATYNLYNTQDGDGTPTIPVEMHIVLTTAKTLDLAQAPFNPFIYLSIGGLRTETHLINHAPTALHEQSFGTDDDASDAANGKYYLTAEGLPWAVEVNGAVGHTLEQTDFAEAYPNIVSWALSGGTTDQDWAQYPVSSKIWTAAP